LTGTSSKERAERVAALAADRKAADIAILELADVSSVTDYFVICTGRSLVHVQAIAQHILDGLREDGERPIAREGIENGQWALIDYGDLVVHVFQPDTRRLYDLERLWSRAPRWTFDERSAIELDSP
jgi:ribosome-associated protein